MSENREEVLANFQACTGIEDVAKAIDILEETNWDLVLAVNRVIAPDSQSFRANNSSPDVEMIEDVTVKPLSMPDIATDMMSVGNNVANHSHDIISQPSTSSSKIPNKTIRMIRFLVIYQGKEIPVDIPDTGTVGELKVILHSQLGLMPCQQQLSGWARMPQYESTPLHQLMLPSENTLFLTTNQQEGAVMADEESAMTERLTGNYTLNIVNDSTGKVFNLKYPGTKAVLEIKGDIFTLTDIPVRHQMWKGWPRGTQDQTMLALTGIAYPEHNFVISKSPSIKNTTAPTTIIELRDSDTSSVEEFEDASESFNVEDDMFMDNLASKKIEPLLPETIDDETIACIHFSEQFSNRYGPVHPHFFTGTLDDALKEACVKPARDRKILAMYLHHDGSVLSNVFCTQLLGFESVMQLIETNYILWGWDLTFEANRIRLQTTVSRALGPVAAVTLRNIPVDRLPAIMVIMKMRSSTEVFTVIHGNVGVNELLSSLIEAVEVFTENQRVEIREEEERTARELVKWEQDEAYRESLEADRAKELAKRLQAERETQERNRIETEKKEEEEKREAHRLHVEASLPPEPAQDACDDDITKIRFRLPKGENLERKFHVTSPLKVLLDFLIVKGYPTDDYKVISSWPRRDLTAMDASLTLLELKLCPQETVILEER